MNAINVKSEIGPLKKVLLHRPGSELLNLTPDSLSRLLFDDIPFLPEAQKEHDEFARILKENNIEIVIRQELCIYTKITNFQFIKSVIYIFAIFILLLIANSAFIWKITLKGNYYYTAEQMIDYVHK